MTAALKGDLKEWQRINRTETAVFGPRLYRPAAAYVSTAMKYSRYRLIEFLDGLRKKKFVSEEEFALMQDATEKMLVCESIQRALRREHAKGVWYFLGDKKTTDWTSHKDVFQPKNWHDVATMNREMGR